MPTLPNLALREKVNPHGFISEHPILAFLPGRHPFMRVLVESLLDEPLNMFLVDEGINHDPVLNELRYRENIRLLDHRTTDIWPATIPRIQTFVFLPTTMLGEHHRSLESVVLETRRLVDMAVQHNATLVLLSSMFVHTSPQSTHAADERRIADYALETFRAAEAIVLDAVAAYGLDGRIVRLPDVYGPHLPTDPTWAINHVFSQAQHHRSMMLVGDGLMPMYPLYVADAVSGILSAAFLGGGKGKTFTLFPEEQTTLLHIAMHIRHLLHDRVPIQYVPGSILHRNHPIPTDPLSWRSVVPLADGLRRTLEGAPFHPPVFVPIRQPLVQSDEVLKAHAPSRPVRRLTDHIRRVRSILPTKVLRKRGVRRTFVATAAAAVLFFLTAPTIQFALAVQNSLRNLDAGASAWILQSASSSSRSSLFGESMGSLLPRPLFVLRAAGRDLIEAQAHINQAFPLLQTIPSLLLRPGSEGIRGDVLGIQSELMLANQKLSTAQALLLEAEGIGGNWPLLGGWLKTSRMQIERGKRDVAGASETMRVLTAFLRPQGSSAYLVVVQDNTVLRPGGGVIRSVGYVRFDRGKLAEISFEDATTLDAKRSGTIAPPDVVKNVLGVSDWSIQEGAWWANFPQSAQASRSLVQSTFGIQTDGVIAIDRTGLKALLTITGPVAIAGHETQLSLENFDEEFGEKTDQRDVGLLLTSVFSSLLVDGSRDWTVVAEKFGELLEEKHLLLSTTDPALARSLSESHWDGAWTAWDVVGEGEVLLPFAAILADIGSSSAEPKISIQREIRIGSDRSIDETLSIRGASSPGEDEGEILLQLYVPKNADVRSVKLDGTEIEPVVVLEKRWKNVWIKTMVSDDERVFSVELRHGVLWNDGNFALKLLQMKQPGTHAVPYTVSVRYPESLIASQVRPTANVLGPSLVWETDLRKDRIMEVRFGAGAGVSRGE
ncbi:MAG: DUF4012 domain-containing protein [bacterium]|nr:DUF4012 domain-containing protein [bacterium]